MMRFGPGLRTALLVALTLLVTAGIYLPTLEYPPVWDDHDFFEQNEQIRSIRNVGQFFVSEPKTTHGGVFRPIVYVYHALLFQLDGGRPRALRLFLIVCSVVAAILMWAIVRRAERDLGESAAAPSALAPTAALLFLMHPVHVEAVVWLSGGGYCVSGLLYIASFALYQRSRMLLSLLFFALGLLTTEMVATLPAVICVYALLFRRASPVHAPGLRRVTLVVGLFLAALVLYLAYRYFILGQMTRGIEPYGGSVWLTIISMVRVIMSYIQLMIWPGNLLADHAFAVLDWSRFAYVLFLGELILLGVALVALFRHRDRMSWFFLLWFFITLIPVSNIVPSGGTPEAERYLYLPSVGAMALLASVLVKARAWHARLPEGHLIELRPWASAALIVLVTFFAARSMSQARVWRSEETLWDQALLQNIGSTRPHSNYCGALWMRGDLPGLLAAYRRAQRWTGQFQADLAALLIELGQRPRARELLEATLSARPHDVAARRLYGQLLLREGRVDAARAYLGSLPASATDVPARHAMATIALLRGDSATFRAHVDTLVRNDPRLREACLYLLPVHFDAAGRNERALEAWQDGLARHDTTYFSATGCAVSLAKLGRDREAEALLRRNIEYHAEIWQAWHNLSYFYITRGRYQDARSLLRTALAGGGDQPALLADLAHCELMVGDTASADSSLARLGRQWPTFHRAFGHIGRMYQRRGMMPEARRALDRYLKLDEENPLAFAYLGDWHSSRGDARRRDEYYRAALEKAQADSLKIASLLRETRIAEYTRVTR